MVSFTLFIVLPTEEICTLRRITSGVRVNEIKSMLEVSVGVPSHIYHLSSSRYHSLNDDYVLELHRNVWNGFLYRAEVNEEWRSLFGAVVKGDVDWLLRKGRVCERSCAVYNTKSNNEASLELAERGCVALYLASWLGSSKMCQTLLSVGVNPNGATRNNRTPLFAAAARDNYQVVNILLNHGAKLSVSDCNGDTPLDIARRNSAKQCIKRILSTQNISIYNLKAKDVLSSTETQIAIPQVEDNVGLENTALVEFTTKRPFTSQERANAGCGYTLKVKPNTSSSRRSNNISSRSVTFNVEKEHSLHNRNDRTLLPDVRLRTSSAHARSPNGVSFSEQRPRVSRIPELSEGITLWAAKSLPKSAPGKSWRKSKDVVTWNNSTTGLECLYARSLLGKQKPGNHSDTDLNIVVETEPSYIAKKIYHSIPAQSLIIPQNEQSDDAKDIDFNMHALNLLTAENEQSGVDKKTDLGALTLNSTTAATEQSEVSMNIDYGSLVVNLTTDETEQSAGAKITQRETPSPKPTNEATHYAGVSSTDPETHNANDSNENVDSASNLYGDSKANTSSNSMTDARPKTANCPVLRRKGHECNSAGLMRAAARQIKIAEHRKRIKSASDKSMGTDV